MGYMGRKLEGATVPIVGTFRNAAGALADPNEAELRIRNPDETVAVYRWPTPGVGETILVQDSLGTFHADYSLQEGITWIRWTGTGAVANVDEDFIYAEPSHVV